MSSTPPHRPTSALGKRLLEAARADAPPASSIARAEALVAAAPEEAPQKESAALRPSPEERTRWLVWALPAAAALIALTLVSVWRKTGQEASMPAAPSLTPDPAQPTESTEPAPTSKVAAAPTPIPASPSASASPEPTPAPSRIAIREDPRPMPGAPPAPQPAMPKNSGSGACGCAASDLMCHMRCSQGKKKK